MIPITMDFPMPAGMVSMQRFSTVGVVLRWTTNFATASAMARWLTKGFLFPNPMRASTQTSLSSNVGLYLVMKSGSFILVSLLSMKLI